MSKEIAKILRQTAEKVEQGWCQHKFAKDESGCGVEPTAEVAVSWCIAGAVCCVLGVNSYSGRPTPYYAAIERAMISRNSPISIASYNDNYCQTKDDAISILLLAAQLEED